MPLWLSIVVLAVVLFGSLLLIPLGLPGLWVMLGAGLLFNVLVPASGIGAWTLIGCGILAIIAEALEFTIGMRYLRKYGGSRRASWGAMLGGIVGAFVGVPVPIIGSVIGAFVGAFVGALLGELSLEKAERGDVTRVATGAVVGRAMAAAAKTGIGVIVAVWLLAAAFVGGIRESPHTAKSGQANSQQGASQTA